MSSTKGYTEPSYAPPPYNADSGMSQEGMSAQSPLIGQEPDNARDDIPDDFKYSSSVATCALEIRMMFVRKVYSILTVQLIATAAFSALFMFNRDWQRWIHQNAWLTWISMFGSIGTLFLLMWKRSSYPTNFIFLSLFTGLEALAIGNVVSYYDSNIVMQALLITLAIFVGLTLFTLQSKYDFSSWGTFLFSGLWMLIATSLLALFFPTNSWAQLGFSLVGAAIFSGYIMYDTYILFHRLSPEEYIMASVSLYLDILNLFLNILRILNNSDNN